jgi:hypothetical protein
MSGENTAAASVGGAKLPRHKLSRAGYGSRFVCPLPCVFPCFASLLRKAGGASKEAFAHRLQGGFDLVKFLDPGNWVSLNIGTPQYPQIQVLVPIFANGLLPFQAFSSMQRLPISAINVRSQGDRSILWGWPFRSTRALRLCRWGRHQGGRVHTISV